MNLQIGPIKRDWTVHPRPLGGDLVITCGEYLLVVDTYRKIALNPMILNQAMTLPQGVVDKLLDEELVTAAYPQTATFHIDEEGFSIHCVECSPQARLATSTP